MSRWKTMTLSGWGQTAQAAVDVARPERLKDLHDAVLEGGHLLAHGLGRSYGDEALPTHGSKAILLHRLDRLISFDDSTGLLVAEAGISFNELLRIFLPRGWMLPVAPGTAFVTLGGAIANNVHGKNHPAMGALSKHIDWLDLLLVDGRTLRCSRTENAELFMATLGGLGLTGIITRAALRLLKVPGQAMAVTSHRVGGLERLLREFRDLPAGDPYAVAWIDALAGGGALGRGIFERAHHVDMRVPPYKEKGPTLPVALPNITLNPLSIGVFNRLRYAWVGRAHPTVHIMHARQFFYPLDRIAHWNRMYGKRGFHQFQAVIGEAQADAGIRQLLEIISASRQASFLAVLKRMGGPDEGLLSFAKPGFTLALDFPNTPETPALIRRLIDATRNHDGRVYLAKDSLLTAQDFAAMYPQAQTFKDLTLSVDPGQRLRSQMALRLDLRSAS